MSAFSKGRAGARRARPVGPALAVMLLLLYAACATSAEFPPASGAAAVEFHIEFVDLNFSYGIYEFAWDATCHDCAAEPVSCKATLDRVDLMVNADAHGGVVVLPAFPPAFPVADPDIHCLPSHTSEPLQGTLLYQLVVKAVPAGDVLVNSSCDATILFGVNVIRHTELPYGESSNLCAPEVGGT